MNRPYTANYAIGFMFVTGIILFFQGMCEMRIPISSTTSMSLRTSYT